MIYVNKLKHFFPGEEQSLDADSYAKEIDSDLIKSVQLMQCPLTSAWSKLIKSDTLLALINKLDVASP